MFSTYPFSTAPFSDEGASKTYSLSCDAGSYALTGNAASFAYGKILSAGQGSYLYTGNAATFTKTYVLTAEPGAYVYTGKDADLNYNPAPIVIESKGGIGKKEKKKREAEKASREELEAIVKREFDILDGTYQPEIVEIAKQTVLPKIKEIDYTQYQIALAQVNALLLQAKIRAAEYESELDDEEALLMLL